MKEYFWACFAVGYFSAAVGSCCFCWVDCCWSGGVAVGGDPSGGAAGSLGVRAEGAVSDASQRAAWKAVESSGTCSSDYCWRGESAASAVAAVVFGYHHQGHSPRCH